MPEAKYSYDQAIASVKEDLGRDGHMLENAVSLLVHQGAMVREFFPSYIDATFTFIDAMLGKKTGIPRNIVDHLVVLNIVINDDSLIQDAFNTGMASSPDQIEELKRSFKESLPALRQVALNRSLPGKAGEPSVNLASRIQATQTK